MALLKNIDALTAADILGGEATPVLSISNSSTGPGIKVDRFLATAGATIISGATATPALQLSRTGVVGNSSTALLNVLTSGASVPVFALQGSAFVSAVSLIFAAGSGWAGMGAIRVLMSDGVTAGWIPVLPNSQVTAAVAT